MFQNFSGKIALAGVTDFDLNNLDREFRSLVFGSVENKSFAILQELHIEWQIEQQQALIGRNEYVTPMIDAAAWYMLVNSFLACIPAGEATPVLNSSQLN